MDDFEIVNEFERLSEEAEKEDMELETDDGCFLLRVKDSKNSDHVFKCCKNLREVDVFLDGIFCARLIEGKERLNRYTL